MISDNQRKQDTQQETERNTVVGYGRLSMLRDGDNSSSPERQLLSIEEVSQKIASNLEVFTDFAGHRSGRDVDNRPGMQALLERLEEDDDISALVVYNLSRLFRNTALSSQLFDLLREKEIALVNSSHGVTYDLTDDNILSFLKVNAVFDEAYVRFISTATKKAIRHKKSKGQTVGRPPFGTTRDKEGYLVPRLDGAWLLPDGNLVAGMPDSPPCAEAIWRGYADSVLHILTLYAENNIGKGRLTTQLNEEGWAFCDKSGEPRLFKKDDVRRIIANWYTYGGIVVDGRAKDSNPFQDCPLDEIPFVPERAAFPVELLRRVAEVQRLRSVCPKDHGSKPDNYRYPLSVITLCAKCVRQVTESDGKGFPGRLTGSYGNGVFRYVHTAEVKCNSKAKSVHCDVYEAEFGLLLEHLTVRPEALESMARLALEIDRDNIEIHRNIDLEAKRQQELALCHRRLKANSLRFGAGEIDEQEWREIRVGLHRRIKELEEQGTGPEQIYLELKTCVDTLNDLVQLWEKSEAAERQQLVRSLFAQIVYDLDEQQIVSFQLNPWAKRFLMARVTVLTHENAPGDQVLRRVVPPRGSLVNPCFPIGAVEFCVERH